MTKCSQLIFYHLLDKIDFSKNAKKIDVVIQFICLLQKII